MQDEVQEVEPDDPAQQAREVVEQGLYIPMLGDRTRHFEKSAVLFERHLPLFLQIR